MRVAFAVPLLVDQSPHFELLHGDELVSSIASPIVVASEVEYPDMSHYAGDGLDCKRPLPAGPFD